MTLLIVTPLVFLGVFLWLIAVLRRLGSRDKRPILTVVQRPNTTCLIISAPNTETIDKEGKVTGVNDDGGPFVRILHTVEGKYLDETDPDPMNHKLVKENAETGRVDTRDLFYRWFGLQFIWLYRYVRINSIRKSRWGRLDSQTEYSMMAKTGHTLYPDFSGQHDMKMDGVETGKVLGFNMRFNFTLEETFPYRARMRTADSYAQFTIMVGDHVVNMMGNVDPTEFIGNIDKQDAAKQNLKKGLTNSFTIREVLERIEDETGLTIRSANLPAFDFDAPTKALLEASARALLEGNANVIKAEKDKRVKELANEADKHRVENFYGLLTELMVRAMGMEAYRDNGVVSTFAPGSNSMLTIPGQR